MIWICLMLKLVKRNDTLVNSDTRLAFVAILYVSFALSLPHSLATSQSTNEGPCLRVVSITML